jgi:hypothetical protein
VISDIAKIVLGTLVMRPNFLDIDIVELDESLFSTDRERRVFRIIARIWENDRPGEILLAVIHAEFTSVEDRLYIDTLCDGLPKSTPENFRLCVRELRRHRLSEKILKAAESQSREYLETGVFDEASQVEIKKLITEQDGQGGAFDPYTFMRTGLQLQALDIHVDWIVDKLIPEGAITLLHGPGGLGKTWLCLALAKSISEGTPFLGLQTKRREVVYVDYENPLAIDHDRSCKLNVCAPRFWHLSDPTRPPKLDGPDWHLLKALRPGSLIIIDTARGATDGDEIKGQDVALVMNRLKEIRELGQDIVLQAHTSKANKKISKGATTWEDLADHVLAFYRVRPGTLEEIEEEGLDPNALLFLGTGNKTRYEPCRFYVSLDATNGVFTLIEEPRLAALESIADYIESNPERNQSEIIDWAKEAGVGPKMRENFINLLNRGEREGRWRSHKAGKKRVYVSSS